MGLQILLCVLVAIVGALVAGFSLAVSQSEGKKWYFAVGMLVGVPAFLGSGFAMVAFLVLMATNFEFALTLGAFIPLGIVSGYVFVLGIGLATFSSRNRQIKENLD